MRSWKSWIGAAAVVALVGCGDELALLAAILTATWDTNSITLTWDPVDGAESYDVYRGITQAGMILWEEGWDQTAYTDNTSVAGVVYYFAVHARDGDTDSGPSNVVTAFPHTPPAAAGKVYENTSGQGSYYVFRMAGGVATGEDLTLAQADEADFGLNTHESGNPVDPELRSPHFTVVPNGRVSQFALVQSGASQNDFDALIEGFEADYVWVDELNAESAGLYLVKTQDGNFAKLWIISGNALSPFDGAGDDEYVEFEWDYNPNGLILF